MGVSWATMHRLLWRISRVGGGALTNERAANITGTNPAQLNDWWMYAGVTLGVAVLNGATFTGVRIYGAHQGYYFPPPGSAAEALASSGPGVLGALVANQGVFRLLQGQGGDAGTKLHVAPVPPWLLLEYDMGLAGGGTSALEIFLTALGPEITGHE